MAELDFEKLFKIQMDCMKLNQSHPDIKHNKYWVLKLLIGYGIYTLYFILLLNCIKYYLSRNDFFNSFRNGVPVVYYICMMVYFCLLIKNGSKLKNLIKCMKIDYIKANQMNIKCKCIIQNQNNECKCIRQNQDNECKCTIQNQNNECKCIRQNIKCKSIIQDHAKKGEMILKFWFILMVNSLVIFLVKNIIICIYNTKKSGYFTLVPFHDMHYPLNITAGREHDVLLFITTYVGEFYFTATSVHLFICIIPLGPIFMLHTCGQMELIKIKFENIFESENVDDNLKDIVQHLQYVFSFVKEINECFTIIYEIMLKQNIILLPCTSYAIIQSISREQITIEYAGIFIQSLLTSSLPCYYGDLLMQRGEEVRLAAYNCGWERVHLPRARKTLLIIMARLMRPVAIKTVFTTINLDTLTNVYHQAYTIFNLMTAMW